MPQRCPPWTKKGKEQLEKRDLIRSDFAMSNGRKNKGRSTQRKCEYRNAWGVFAGAFVE